MTGRRWPETTIRLCCCSSVVGLPLTGFRKCCRWILVCSLLGWWWATLLLASGAVGLTTTLEPYRWWPAVAGGCWRCRPTSCVRTTSKTMGPPQWKLVQQLKQTHPSWACNGKNSPFFFFLAIPFLFCVNGTRKKILFMCCTLARPDWYGSDVVFSPIIYNTLPPPSVSRSKINKNCQQREADGRRSVAKREKEQEKWNYAHDYY